MSLETDPLTTAFNLIAPAVLTADKAEPPNVDACIEGYVLPNQHLLSKLGCNMHLVQHVASAKSKFAYTAAGDPSEQMRRSTGLLPLGFWSSASCGSCLAMSTCTPPGLMPR